MNDPVQNAVRVLSEAHALIISAGAGMGSDFGLPFLRPQHGLQEIGNKLAFLDW